MKKILCGLVALLASADALSQSQIYGPSNSIFGASSSCNVTNCIYQPIQTLPSGLTIPLSDIQSINPGTMLGSCASAYFNGSISTTTLTVNSVLSGAIAIGQTIYGPNVTTGTTITAGSGTSWTISPSQTSSGQMWSGNASAPSALTSVCPTSLLNALSFGTSEYLFYSYPAQLMEISQGTVSVPWTIPGAAIKISRVENYTTSACIAASNNECNSPLEVINIGTSSDQLQVNAGFFAAETLGSNPSLGIQAISEGISGGTGLAQGAYLQGSRTSTFGKSLAGEFRVYNGTTSNCGVSYTGLGICDDIWITAQSNATATTLSSGVHIGIVSGTNGFAEGITINNASAVNYGFNDQSSSTTSVNVGSNHTTAFSSPSFSVSGSTGYVSTPAIQLVGSSTGYNQLQSNNATAANYTNTLPAVSGGIGIVLIQTGIPFVIPSSGSIGNNGALSAITALPRTISGGAYFYFPAGAISSGSAAGWYWTVMSSSTAGTIYNSVYSSGQPEVGTTTAFSTTGPGAYTQSTTAVTGPSITVPANSMGINGSLDTQVLVSCDGATSAKYVLTNFGGNQGPYIDTATSTVTIFGGQLSLTNQGVSNSQVGIQASIGGGEFSASAGSAVIMSVPTSSAATFALKMQISTAATDFLILERFSTKEYPSS